MEKYDVFLKIKHQYITALVISIVFFIIYFSVWYLSSLSFAFLLLGSIVIGLFINIYRFYKWRCPECNSFLGNTIYAERCPKCECNLTGEKIFDSETSDVKPEVLPKKIISVSSKIEISEALKDYEKTDILN